MVGERGLVFQVLEQLVPGYGVGEGGSAGLLDRAEVGGTRCRLAWWGILDAKWYGLEEEADSLEVGRRWSVEIRSPQHDIYVVVSGGLQCQGHSCKSYLMQRDFAACPEIREALVYLGRDSA